MSDENRKYLRFECLVPVENIKFGEGDAPTKDAVLDSVSRDGLHIILDLDFSLSPGHDVDFDIEIPDKKVDSKVSGEVMWTRPKGDRLEVGIRIKNMSKVTKSELLELGYDRWREERRKEIEKKKP
jgi:hypothetical protein